MMHHREKKKNNIYISSGAFWCIGALRCIWCICTIMPFAAFSQTTGPLKSDDVWMKIDETEVLFKTRLHNDIITSSIDSSKIQVEHPLKIFYSSDVAEETPKEYLEIPASANLNIDIQRDGYYFVHGTSKSNRDSILAIYQVLDSEVIIFKKQSSQSKN